MLTPRMVFTNASNPVREVQIVIDLVNGLLARHPVLEIERANARFDSVGCRNRFQSLAGDLRPRRLNHPLAAITANIDTSAQEKLAGEAAGKRSAAFYWFPKDC
jgi:hypothetical protein